MYGKECDAERRFEMEFGRLRGVLVGRCSGESFRGDSAVAMSNAGGFGIEIHTPRIVRVNRVS